MRSMQQGGTHQENEQLFVPFSTHSAKIRDVVGDLNIPGNPLVRIDFEGPKNTVYTWRFNTTNEKDMERLLKLKYYTVSKTLSEMIGKPITVVEYCNSLRGFGNGYFFILLYGETVTEITFQEIGKYLNAL